MNGSSELAEGKTRLGVPVDRRGVVTLSGAALAVALYLLVTLVPLVAGGVTGARGWVLVAHLLVLVLLLAPTVPRWGGRLGWTRPFHDLHILILLPALYAELPFLMEGLPGPVVYRDPLIQSLELVLFGFQPAWELAGVFPSALLSEPLHLAYLLYYPIIYLPPLLLYLRHLRGGETRAALQETLAALALAVLSCFLVFVVFPVQGPRYIEAPPGIPDGPVRGIVLAVLEGGSSRGAAFPSSHVSVAVAQTLLALRFQPRLGWTLVPVTVLLALGAVYGGFHYALDALVGAAVGAGAAWLARPLARRAFPASPGGTGG